MLIVPTDQTQRRDLELISATPHEENSLKILENWPFSQHDQDRTWSTSTARHFSLHHNDSALSRLAIPTPRVDTLILKSDPPSVRRFDRKPENQLSRCLAGSSPVITTLEVGLVANLHQIRSIGWVFPAEGDNNNGYTTYGVLYS